MSVARAKWLAAVAATLVVAGEASAVIPYSPVPVAPPPSLGTVVSTPPEVWGKEYSHDFDFSVIGPVPDPEQIIAWDGSGGTADTFLDYTGTRPTWTPDQEIDAIANSRDALFYEVRGDYDNGFVDVAHLNFTHDDTVAGYVFGPAGPVLSPFTMPSAGPVTLSNGNIIGGAGEISVEESIGFGAAPSTQYVWAKQPEVNGMPLPVDVDGTEQYGPEPVDSGGQTAPVIGDSDKYSLDVDVFSGVSVWNGAGSPYIGLGTITAAVTSLLGPVPPTAFSFYDDTQGPQAINLDALMVMDTIEEPDFFHQDIGFPGGGEEVLDQNGDPVDTFNPDGTPRGDSIIFSIRQIVDPADPDGYYATGSELFVIDSLAPLTGLPFASFLNHGGHLWDHAYSLAELLVFSDTQEGFSAIDINGIEAVGGHDDDLCPGDFDGDGDIDIDDFGVFVAAFQASPTGGPPFDPADFDMDGDVDLDDFGVFVAGFQSKPPGGVPVPEPVAAGMLFACLASAMAMRWRLG